MYIIFNAESVTLKKSKFASKEKKSFRSGGVKSNDENMMKSNDGIPSPYGSENEGRSLNKNIPIKQ